MEESTCIDIKAKEAIENFSTDKLNQLLVLDNTSHLNEILNSPEGKQLINGFAGFLGNAVRDAHAAKFHESLNCFEKCGLLSSSKRRKFELKNSILASTATAAIPFILQGAEIAKAKHEENSFVTFVLAWIGYISNTEATPQLITQATKILSSANINLNPNTITEKITYYSKQSYSQIPHITSKILSTINSQEGDMMSVFAKEIIAPCDLSDSTVKDRALQFLEECFGISHLEAEKKIEEINSIQDYHLHLTGFSSACFITSFSKFATSAKEAYEFGKYNESMDIYAQKRKENKQKLIEFGVTAATAAAETAMTKNPAALLKILQVPARRDLLEGSSELMQNTYNPDGNIMQGMKLITTTSRTAKELGITD